jgi:hypothetical protein
LFVEISFLPHSGREFRMRFNTLILSQAPITVLVLAFVPGNSLKLVALICLWLVTFQRLSRTDLVFYVIVCIFFTGMNAASLQQGIFAFSHPDVLGMPLYELLMWGFYTLHTRRLLGGAAPEKDRAAWVLAVLYSIAFAAIPDQTLLLAATGTLLAIGLIRFHEPLDLAYTGYMVLLGAAIEYTGVWSGEWHYPGDPFGGVPLWFITLWGGVGLFLRRLVLPVLARYETGGKPVAGTQL